MKANFHTHTPRCLHARLSEREAIEAAIAGGLTTLGFSDHAPYDYGEHAAEIPKRYSMLPEETEDYVKTLLSLREEYRDRINILIGFEAEYFSKLFPQFLRIIRPYPVDYLILGHHYTNNRFDGVVSGKETDQEEDLAAYSSQVCAAIETGLFSYVAHPDIIRYTGDDAIYQKYMTRLCKTAKEHDIPLEMNFLGFSEKRHYPCDRFFRIAAEVGNTVIFGCDAHNTPDQIPNSDAVAKCTEWANRLGLSITEEIRFPLHDLSWREDSFIEKWEQSE